MPETFHWMAILPFKIYSSIGDVSTLGLLRVRQLRTLMCKFLWGIQVLISFGYTRRGGNAKSLCFTAWGTTKLLFSAINTCANMLFFFFVRWIIALEYISRSRIPVPTIRKFYSSYYLLPNYCFSKGLLCIRVCTHTPTFFSLQQIYEEETTINLIFIDEKLRATEVK